MRSPERPHEIFATPAEAAHLLVQQARHDQHTADQARAEGDRVAADVYQGRADAGARKASRLMADVGLPVSGGGGEIVPATKPDMVDTLKDPSLANIEASDHRIDLLEHAGVLTLGLDVAETIGATNSVEKLLARQMAAAHALGLRFAARATMELDRHRPAGAVTEAAGIGLVATALMALAVGGTGAAALPRMAPAWLLLAGAGTAAYVMCDVQGVRLAGSPWAYGFAVSIGNASTMYWRHGRQAGGWRFLVTDAPRAVPTGIAAMVSYLLVLWVWSGAPAASTAALRDTSAIFAILIAVLWLKEPFTKARLAAVVLATAAVPLLRLA